MLTAEGRACELRAQVWFTRANGTLYPVYGTSTAASNGEIGRANRVGVQAWFKYVYVHTGGPYPIGDPCEGMVVGKVDVRLNGTSIGASMTREDGEDGSRTYSGSNYVPIDPGMNSVTATSGLTTQIAIGYMQIDAAPMPSIFVANTHNGENVDPTRCVANCFEKVHLLSTPAYVSLGQPRSATLVYRSGRATPRGEVTIDFKPVLSFGASLPNRLAVGLKNDSPSDTTWEPLINTLGTADSLWHYFQPTADSLQRLAVQFDARDDTTGVYAYKAFVRAQWDTPSGVVSHELVANVRVIINNERNSVFGAGWLPAEYSRVRTTAGGVLLTTGAGHAQYFATGSTTGDTTGYQSPKGDFSTLARAIGSGQWVRRWADGSRAIYGGITGQIVRIEDRFGNAAQYAYDNQNRLLQIVDPAGQMTQIGYEYDAGCWCKLGTIRSITTPGGRVNYYAVDQANNLLHAVNPGGFYDMVGEYNGAQLVGVRDAESRWWRTGYDHAGRIAADSAPAIGTAEHGSVSLVTSYRSVESLVAARGTAASTTTPHPMVSSANAVARITPPAGQASEVASDRFGNPVMTRVTGVANTQVLIVRDLHGRPTATSGPQAGHWNAIVWTEDRPTRITTSAGGDVNYAYGAFAQVDSVYGTLSTVDNYLGTNGRIDSTRVGVSTGALMTRFQYDARGNLKEVVSPDQRDTTTFYRQLTGLLNVDSVRYGARVAKFRYDQMGRAVSTTSPDGKRDSARFDALNRVLAVQNNAGYWTQQEYNALVPTALVDAKGQRYEFKSNAILMDTALVDPRGEYSRYIPDNRGLPRWVDNRRGQRIVLTSDSIGRPIQLTHDARQVTYAYEASGRYAVITNHASVDTVFTDSATVQREVSARTNGLVFETTRRLDLSTRVLATTTKLRLGGSVAPWTTTWTTAMDSSWRVTAINPDGSNETVFGYGTPGAGDTAWIGSGAERAILKRRPSGQLESIDFNDNSLSYLYGRDSAGRVTFRIQTDPNAGFINTYDPREIYTYDAVGRLSGWSRETGSTMCVIQWGGSADAGCPGANTTSSSYAYDAVGNPSSGATVGNGNRLEALGDTAMFYDYDGNLDSLQMPGRYIKYWWNSLGQLDSAYSSVQGKVRYEYDGLGRRITRRTDSSAEHYVYSGADVMADVASTGAWNARYSYYPGVDRPHSITRSSGATHWYVDDGRGNVRGLVDVNGVRQANYEYTPFGAAAPSTSTWDNVGNRYRFAGREWDEALGLYYNRARYYSPSMRRFISEDPTGLAGGINAYVYASNDPIAFNDPTGTEPCSSNAERAGWRTTSSPFSGEPECVKITLLPPVRVMTAMFGLAFSFDLPSLAGNFGPLSTMGGLVPQLGNGGGGSGGTVEGAARQQQAKKPAAPKTCTPTRILNSAVSGATSGMAVGAAFGAVKYGLAGATAGAAVGTAAGAAGGSLIAVFGAVPGAAIGLVGGGAIGAVTGAIAGTAIGAVEGFAGGFIAGGAWGAFTQCATDGKDPTAMPGM